MQRTSNQPFDQSGIDYVRLANALKEHVEKALQNAVESSPVHIQAIFDTSVHMENNQTAMTIAREEWAKWMKAFGKETISRLPNAPSTTSTPQGKSITFGEDTAYKVPENDVLLSGSEKLDVAAAVPAVSFYFLASYIINHYIFVPSNWGIVNRSSCSLFLPQNVFPIEIFYLRYRPHDFFHIIFFDN